MQNRGQNLQKIPEHHQKTSTFPSAEKGQLILFLSYGDLLFTVIQISQKSASR